MCLTNMLFCRWLFSLSFTQPTRQCTSIVASLLLLLKLYCLLSWLRLLQWDWWCQTYLWLLWASITFWQSTTLIKPTDPSENISTDSMDRSSPALKSYSKPLMSQSKLNTISRLKNTHIKCKAMQIKTTNNYFINKTKYNSLMSQSLM